MPDFTQKKWIYLECSREIFAPATMAEDDPFGLAIAEISFDPDIPEKEKHANGRLIAAAPDLYNLLSLALGYMYDAYNMSTNNAFKHILMNDITRIEALFARIDGTDTDKEEN